MKIHQVGHAVLKVRDIDRAEAFYGGVLGLRAVARMDMPPMVFYSLGNHHDFAITATGADAPDAPPDAPGLFHLAFKIGDTEEELREAFEHLQANDVPIVMTVDHVVTRSVYFLDPDGNMLEVYVDSSDVWRQDPQTVASFELITL